VDSWPRARYVICIVLMIEVALVAGMLRSGGLYQHVSMDYLTTYTASDMLVHGDRTHLYDTRVQWEYELPVINHHNVHWPDRVMHPYLAPPPLAVIGFPFPRLPPVGATLAWALVNMGAVAAGIWLLARRLVFDWRIAVMIIVGSIPLFATLVLGQVEGLLFLAFIMFIVQLRAGNDRRAGVALAVLAIKPPLLLAPIIYLMVTGRRRALAASIVTGLVEAAISIALLGPAGVRQYMALTRRMAGPDGDEITNVWGMVNLRSAVVRAVPSDHTLFINLSVAALTLLALSGAVWLWRTNLRNAASLPALSLLAMTTVLTAYHALLHSALIAMIGVVLLVVHAIQHDDLHLRNRVLAFSWTLFTILPLVLFGVAQTTRLPATVATIGMLLVWGAAAVTVAQFRVVEPVVEKHQTDLTIHRLRVLVETRQQRPS
jgi:hypothetical protein